MNKGLKPVVIKKDNFSYEVKRKMFRREERISGKQLTKGVHMAEVVSKGIDSGFPGGVVMESKRRAPSGHWS